MTLPDSAETLRRLLMAILLLGLFAIVRSAMPAPREVR